MNLLVESSVWIHSQLPQTAEAFLGYLDWARSEHRIVVTGMVRLEVMAGARTWEELLAMQEDFDHLTNVEPGPDTWTEAARIRMRLRHRGFHLRSPDLLIAAVALENSLTLVHADHDFEPLADVEGLKTESLLHLMH